MHFYTSLIVIAVVGCINAKIGHGMYAVNESKNDDFFNFDSIQETVDAIGDPLKNVFNIDDNLNFEINCDINLDDDFDVEINFDLDIDCELELLEDDDCYDNNVDIKKISLDEAKNFFYERFANCQKVIKQYEKNKKHLEKSFNLELSSYITLLTSIKKFIELSFEKGIPIYFYSKPPKYSLIMNEDGIIQLIPYYDPYNYNLIFNISKINFKKKIQHALKIRNKNMKLVKKCSKKLIKKYSHIIQEYDIFLKDLKKIAMGYIKKMLPFTVDIFPPVLNQSKDDILNYKLEIVSDMEIIIE